MKVFVPPIKSQGIKTKLVEWIYKSVSKLEYDTWVEPFMGTGVVAFNIRPKKAILSDSNPHIIHFYKSLQNHSITSSIVRDFLQKESISLLNSNGEYYYEVRKRFNEFGNPLDFLFLSRSCFNGMMRFNKKGGFNVPFCKKSNRFAPALITKIVNQVQNISNIIDQGDYTFINQNFNKTIEMVSPNDIVYCDPPYIGRNVDYFDSWSKNEEIELKDRLEQTNAKYLLSTWLSNKYRTNNYVFDLWNNCNISTKEHYYHVGGKETNRHAVFEALLSNFTIDNSISNQAMKERIESHKSQLTQVSKTYSIPEQLSLVLEDKKIKGI